MKRDAVPPRPVSPVPNGFVHCVRIKGRSSLGHDVSCLFIILPRSGIIEEEKYTGPALKSVLTRARIECPTKVRWLSEKLEQYWKPFEQDTQLLTIMPRSWPREIYKNRKLSVMLRHSHTVKGNNQIGSLEKSYSIPISQMPNCTYKNHRYKLCFYIYIKVLVA